MHSARVPAAVLASIFAACAGPTSDGGTALPGIDASVVPVELLDLPVSRPPYDSVQVTWKQRLDQPYVFVEHRGDYRRIGRAIAALLERADELGVAPVGPLFCLYYDDPGDVELTELRARACLPVGRAVAGGSGLRYDVLPGTTVAYAIVAGTPFDVPRAYPAIYAWLAERGWAEDGPLREIYLNLGGIERQADLLTEVQVPWAARN